MSLLDQSFEFNGLTTVHDEDEDDEDVLAREAILGSNFKTWGHHDPKAFSLS